MVIEVADASPVTLRELWIFMSIPLLREAQVSIHDPWFGLGSPRG